MSDDGKSPDEVLLELCTAAEEAWRTLRKADEAVRQCLLATEEVVSAFAKVRKLCQECAPVPKPPTEMQDVEHSSMLGELAERDRHLAASMLEETARDFLWNVAWGIQLSRTDRAIAERMLHDAEIWLARAGDDRAEDLPPDVSGTSDRELAQALRRAGTRLGSRGAK